MRNKLGDLVSFISKGIAPKYADNSDKHVIRVLNQRCNRNSEIIIENARYNNLDKKKVPEERILKENDIVINSTGTGTAGRIAQLRKEQLDVPTTVDSHMIILRAKDIDAKFLGYSLKAKLRQLESYAEGSTGQTEINRERLLNETIIDYPDNIDEQRKLVRQIECIDELIRLNKRINDNLLELIDSIYSARQSSDAKKERIRISDLFDTSSTTYRINEHSDEFVWHFSIPNFDQQRYPTIDSVNDIKSNKIIVKPFSVLVSKLNPTTRRIWAPSTDSFNKYSKVCSTEFVSISGNDITEQAAIFAITRSDDFMKYLSSKATGSTNSRQRVKPIDIYSYTLPISKSSLSQIQNQLALLLQKIQSNQDEIITLIKLKQELLSRYF